MDQTQAVKFALDIACGMAFLHTLEPMIPRHYLNSKSVMVRNLKQTFPVNLGSRVSIPVLQENMKMCSYKLNCHLQG